MVSKIASLETSAHIASVALNVPLDRTFDYLIPDHLRGQVIVGGRVRVPFGNRKSELGYCVGLKEESSLPDRRLKSVLRSLDSEPIFTAEMLRLARWMADYYCCAWGEALHAALPAAVRKSRKKRRVWTVRTDMGPADAEAKAQEIFERSPAQSKILRALAASTGSVPVSDVKRVTGTSISSFKSLARKGLIRMEKAAFVDDDPLTSVRTEPVEPPELTPEQQAACDAIISRARNDRFDVILLHGVTSSGKTEVYLQSMADVVRRGKRAIVLVPEISLTPQTVRHFSGRFRRLAVLHSHLTESERRRQWNMIRRGEADVVIGARSAIFAPVPDLGLLIIDEEHENSYKQDNVPRYHARDVSIVRARNEGALVVLGSATPSLESYHNTRIGKYSLCKLTSRIGNLPMPPVEIVDMKHEWAGKANLRVISRRLEACMRTVLAKGEQVILFINRRGYSPYIHCPRCNYIVKCDRCDITMNYHQRSNVVACHYCGREVRPPAACPECGLKNVRFSGSGTERIEHVARALFTDHNVIRMDSDTTVARRSHEKKLEEFLSGRASILVGTQMVAKGLDFPNVTLVGVVNADVALHLADFRARERTFQLLAQVAGRAGRGPKGGRVIVQTFMPEDPSILAASMHDFQTFADRELPHRKMLGYPPYGRMVRIVCRGRDATRVETHMRDLAHALRGFCAEMSDGSQLLGPAPAPVNQIRGRHRQHLLVKSPSSRSIHIILEHARDILSGPSGVKVLVDVDPISML